MAGFPDQDTRDGVVLASHLISFVAMAGVFSPTALDVAIECLKEATRGLEEHEGAMVFNALRFLKYEKDSRMQKYGTVTGRTRSEGPAVQHIPIRTEEGRRLRAVLEKGQEARDYTTTEKRVLDHMIGDAAEATKKIGDDELERAQREKWRLEGTCLACGSPVLVRGDAFCMRHM